MHGQYCTASVLSIGMYDVLWSTALLSSDQETGVEGFWTMKCWLMTSTLIPEMQPFPTTITLDHMQAKNTEAQRDNQAS